MSSGFHTRHRHRPHSPPPLNRSTLRPLCSALASSSSSLPPGGLRSQLRQPPLRTTRRYSICKWQNRAFFFFTSSARHCSASPSVLLHSLSLSSSSSLSFTLSSFLHLILPPAASYHVLRQPNLIVSGRIGGGGEIISQPPPIKRPCCGGYNRVEWGGTHGHFGGFKANCILS